MQIAPLIQRRWRFPSLGAVTVLALLTALLASAALPRLCLLLPVTIRLCGLASRALLVLVGHDECPLSRLMRRRNASAWFSGFDPERASRCLRLEN